MKGGISPREYKIWYARSLVIICNYFNAVKFFILFEVVKIKKEHFLSILTMSLTIILPGTTNN